MESSHPSPSKAKFSDEEGPLSTEMLTDRLWWAGSLGASMAVVSYFFVWAARLNNDVSLWVVGVLCGLFSLYTLASGIDVFIELRRRAVEMSASDSDA